MQNKEINGNNALPLLTLRFALPDQMGEFGWREGEVEEEGGDGLGGGGCESLCSTFSSTSHAAAFLPAIRPDGSQRVLHCAVGLHINIAPVRSECCDWPDRPIRASRATGSSSGAVGCVV